MSFRTSHRDGHYSADSNYFASQPFDNAPLHALANGTDGQMEFICIPPCPASFPVDTYASTNYWVDVLFSPGQSYTVSGTLSGPGAAGATVLLKGGSAGSASTTADSSGNYTFASVFPGNYSVMRRPGRFCA